MKKINFILLLTITMFTACEKGFKELNTNPNAPTTADASALFAQAQKVFFDNGSFYTEALLNSYTWTQQFSNKNVNANIFTRNEFATGVNSSYWSQFYISNMVNISNIKQKLASEPDDLKAVHINQKAMADIVQVLNAHFATDAFGGMPYSEAFKAFNFSDQKLLPRYDSQKDVYIAMLAQLKNAANALTPNADQQNFSSDLWFSTGDRILKWKKLANSLRLRLAMRISKVDETRAKAEIADILSKPAELISSNDDNLVFRYTGSIYESPLYGQTNSFFHETAAAKNLVNFLSDTADPRLRIFFNKATEGTAAGTYVGVPVSPDGRNAAMLFAPGSTKEYNSKYSRGHAAAWFNRKFPELVINYAEVLLLRAEIAQKGWSAENVQQLYEDGIKASIMFYSALYKEGIPNGESKNPTSSSDKAEILDINTLNVTQTELNALLQASGVKYNATIAANQIGVQQWINHHRNPRELLSNFRRTDIPNATSIPQWEPIVAGGTIQPYANIPKRLIYPATEYASNRANLESFLQIQGPDVESTRLWWDID